MNEETLNRVFKILYQIIAEESNERYINVFKVDEKKTDLEPTILEALSRGTLLKYNFIYKHF